MSVDVQVDTFIDQPPAVVSAYAGDPGSAPDWYANIRSVTWQTPPLHQGDPSGFSRLTAPMLERAMQRATTKDLARLKRLLETRGEGA